MKNFQRKQAEYEAAYRRTGDPLALFEALRHATAGGQPAPSWLVDAVGDILMRGRTSQTTERFADRMRHVQRYRCVRDYLRQGMPRKRALNLAVVTLEATDARAGWFTIRDSYDLVSRDLKRKGRESEFFLLVARRDPTVVPVLSVQRPDGVVTINGVRVTASPTVTGSDCYPQQ